MIENNINVGNEAEFQIYNNLNVVNVEPQRIRHHSHKKQIENKSKRDRESCLKRNEKLLDRNCKT